LEAVRKKVGLAELLKLILECDINNDTNNDSPKKRTRSSKGKKKTEKSSTEERGKGKENIPPGKVLLMLEKKMKKMKLPQLERKQGKRKSSLLRRDNFPFL
jgi:hypothetical protein